MRTVREQREHEAAVFAALDEWERGFIIQAIRIVRNTLEEEFTASYGTFGMNILHGVLMKVDG